MDHSIIPTEHPDPWVNLLHAYVSEAVTALASHDLQVHRAWLDPIDPRDATIVLSRDTGNAGSRDELALVWDEETGWRRGRFLGGRQGQRTRLDRIAYLGGGVIPEPAELARRFADAVTVPAREYRSRDDLRDGLDDTLRTRWTMPG